MLVSVIIPTYNDRLRLERCLTALQSQTYSDFEILVVDNNSTENIYSVCEKFSNVIYLVEPTPGSYAARNRGIEQAQGDVIAFTDSDCVPHVDWLKQGAKVFETHHKVGLIGGHIQFFFKGKKPTVAEYIDSISTCNSEPTSLAITMRLGLICLSVALSLKKWGCLTIAC